MLVSELLIEDFKISPSELEKAEQFQLRNGGRLEQILVSLGALSSEQLPRLYSKIYDLELISDDTDIKLELDGIDDDLIKRMLAVGAIPQKQSGETLIALTNAPYSPKLNDLLAELDQGVCLKLCSELVFDRLEKQVNINQDSSDSFDLSSLEEDRLKEMASQAPTVNLLNTLISRGLRQRASDMHIEPVEGRARVRYRIDGVLQEADPIPVRLVLPVVTRLKLLAGMDIAEKRRPQDGKIELRIDGKDVDIRVSALPVGNGESIVMRFLLQESLSYDVAKLGIEKDIENELMRDIESTSGVVLLTGPTGSGKTTSLYSFLMRRNNPSIKIITIEDPIEYQLSGINQVQVQSDIGYSFASALRSVVRQDPDVIMVGEIRDKETASIALQSALTGHLVFSTLHTNDAPSAYTRLLDLGVEEFLLSAAVKSIVAQRLIRKLCPHCSEPDKEVQDQLSKTQVESLKKFLPKGETANFRKPVGCKECANTGFMGRIAVIEYLRCDEQLQELLGHSDFLNAARALNRERGYRTLFEDGLLKVMRGVSTLDEVVRVTG